MADVVAGPSGDQLDICTGADPFAELIYPAPPASLATPAPEKYAVPKGKTKAKKNFYARCPSHLTRTEWSEIHPKEECLVCLTRDHTEDSKCPIAYTLHLQIKIRLRDEQEARENPPPPAPVVPQNKRRHRPTTFHEDFEDDTHDAEDLDEEAYYNIDGEHPDGFCGY